MRLLALGALLAVTSFASPAAASCTWKQDCSSGTCQPVPICDHPYDTPGAVSGDALIPRVVAPGITPITPPRVPPPGASSCSNKYICSHGSCGWQPVCQ